MPRFDGYAEKLQRTELDLQAVAQTLADVRAYRQGRRKRNSDLSYCQERVEATRELLNRLVRELEAMQ